MLWRISKKTGLQVTVVRLPLVYGPGVGGNFLRLLNVIARGIPLPLASVKNKRSMIYNGNVASALIACATHPAAAGKTYLVSDGEDLSTPELLRRLGDMIQRPARLLPCPPSFLQLAGSLAGKGEEVARLTGCLQVDTSAVCNELGWAPPHAVVEGLMETVRWFVCRHKR
jgi:nucleoside-diphosphate-sugar epimerase